MPPTHRATNRLARDDDQFERSQHVLVLDDSDFDRQRISRLLRRINGRMTIHEATTTRSLRDLLDLRTYDVMLLDYRLPDGDGAEAVALVRHHRLNSGCPTIMIAGDETLDNGGKVMQDKCDAYLSKSDLSPTRLRASLATAAMRPGPSRTAASTQGGPQSGPQSGPLLDALQRGADRDAALTLPLDTVNAALDDSFEIIRSLHALRHYPHRDALRLDGDLAEIERRVIRQWWALRHALPQPDGTGQVLQIATCNDRPDLPH